MITLDHEQERVLRDLVIAAGQPLHGRMHRQLQWIGTRGLTFWQWLMPRDFERWNRERIATQGTPAHDR